MTTPNPRTLLTGTTPGPWSDQWHQPEPCVVSLVGYTKIDGYNHPQEWAADIAQKDKDRALATAAPDLAARVIALEDGIRALHSRETIQVITGDCAAEECDHENECPTVPIEVCAECYRIAEEADPYYGENGVRTVLYPCPTIALLAGEAGE